MILTKEKMDSQLDMMEDNQQVSKGDTILFHDLWREN